MKYIVYETVNLINGMKYRGVHQTNNLDDGYFGSGQKLIEAIEEFGYENFERKILKVCESSKEMFEVEKKFVDREWVDSSDTYNLKTGGHGGWDYINKSGINNIGHSSDWYFQHCIKISNLSATKKARSETMKQRHKDGLVKYDTFTGKKHSMESRKKMSDTRKLNPPIGKKNGMYGKRWISKDGECKLISGEDSNYWINDGWNFGKK